MLKITANFNFDAIRKRMNAEIDEKIKRYIEAYKRAGKEFITTARTNKHFGDITFNLVSSIGYILIVNHAVVDSYFPTVSGGAEGSKTGEGYAREIATLIDDGGIILICVAGMHYAAAVESRNKDVISGTDLRFTEILRRQLKA